MDDKKKKALDSAIALIEKDYGKGAVMKLGDNAKLNVEVMPTGCLSLDIALGVGGLPRGRIVEIYGPEAGGKTTVALHAVAEAQKNGGVAAFIDAEHALDPVYAKAIGVDIDELYISQPDNGEQALEIAERMVASGAIDLIVVDSVAALVPRQEIQGDMTDVQVGLQARMMSKALRKLTSVISKSNSVLIFINQLREKIGGNSYGPNETTTGGRALKFYASVRLEVRRTGYSKDGTDIIGSEVKIKVAKNKVAPPFKEALFEIDFGKGISKESMLLKYGIDAGYVQKSGSWFSSDGVKIGQGKEKAKEFLKENTELASYIEELVRYQAGLSPVNQEVFKKVKADLDAKNPVKETVVKEELAIDEEV